MPTAKLSSVEIVDITARVSLSGQPRASKGDLFTELSQIKVNNNGQKFNLVIDRIVK